MIDTAYGSVPNIIARGATVAFMLESPHVDEVAQGYPLAGSAGRAMSEHLFGLPNVPLGEIARDLASTSPRVHSPCANPFSIINVSMEPLQRRAFTKNGLPCPSDIEVREKLKKSLQGSGTFSTKHRDPHVTQLRGGLYARLQAECSGLQPGTVMVPCGRFARAFAKELLSDKAIARKLSLFPHAVHHPAWGWWSRMPVPVLTRLRRLLC